MNVLFLKTSKFIFKNLLSGDVIRADAKEIPRIFQVKQLFYRLWFCLQTRLIRYNLQLLYAGEGESRKPGDNTHPPEIQMTKDVNRLQFIN